MNYRHAFHAGNFADVMKHAMLLQALARVMGEGALTVVDTHAGAGRYDLEDEPSRRSGEAEAGVLRLMQAHDAPSALSPLTDAVRACNPHGGLRWYPGSPTLIAQGLRHGDRYLGCELRADDHHALREELRRAPAPAGVERQAIQADGYAQAQAFLKTRRRGLIFVDPPFESADDYERIVELVQSLGRRADVSAVIWTPLKDLETFDGFLRRLEASGIGGMTVAEARLRSLDNPMRMNGCALVLIGIPNIGPEALAICSWVASALGELGANASVYEL